MKTTLIIFTTFLVLTMNCYGQGKVGKQTVFKPFSLLIIKPDSAAIFDSLTVFADSIEKKHLAKYYYYINMLESFKEMGDEKSREETALQIQALKSREMEAYDFRYYHLVSQLTVFELTTLFNANASKENHDSRSAILEADVIDRYDLFTYDLKKLTKYYKVDYIITFEDFHTSEKEQKATLTYVITLFSAKKNQVILKKEIEGNTQLNNFKFFYQINSPGSKENKFHETAVDCDNYLECMIKSAVRFSSEEIFNAIGRNQKR
jgi:hypothetical protein